MRNRDEEAIADFIQPTGGDRIARYRSILGFQCDGSSTIGAGSRQERLGALLAGMTSATGAEITDHTNVNENRPALDSDLAHASNLSKSVARLAKREESDVTQ